MFISIRIIPNQLKCSGFIMRSCQECIDATYSNSGVLKACSKLPAKLAKTELSDAKRLIPTTRRVRASLRTFKGRARGRATPSRSSIGRVDQRCEPEQSLQSCDTESLPGD